VRSQQNGAPKEDGAPQGPDSLRSRHSQPDTHQDTGTDQQLRAYECAASHLLAVGLTPAPDVPALRVMWKAGPESRRMAQIIADRWELAS
jgi:hypothetical protein